MSRNRIVNQFMGTKDVDYEHDYNPLMEGLVDKIENIIEKDRPDPICKKGPSFFYVTQGIIAFKDSNNNNVRISHNNESTRKARIFSCCFNFIIWYKSNVV